MSFESRTIGRTSVKVSAVAFGCASIGNLYRESSDAASQEVLRAAWDAGIRYFDTAPHYGRGLSEQRLGMFLRGRLRDGIAISTKVGRVLSPGQQHAEQDGFINPLPNDVHYDYSGDGIEAALDGSRSRLGTNFIDIVYVHDIGSYTHGSSNAGHMEAFLGSGYERLVRLKERKEIGAFGLGVNEVDVCFDVLDFGPLDAILLAGRLTLIDRSAEAKLVPRCLAAGTSLVLGGIFNSGILATGTVPNATYDYAPASDAIKAAVDDLERRAQKLGLSLAEAALHFALGHPASASVLIGTANPLSLRRNIDFARQPAPATFAKVFH